MDTVPHQSSGIRRNLELVVPASLGDRLRSWRLKNEKTQAQLAKILGVRPQTVSAWERGKGPQRRFFGQIADLLNLPNAESVEVLLNMAGEANPDAGFLGEPPSRPRGPASTAPLTELQETVVRAVAQQLASGRPPSRRQAALFERLLGAVGVDPSEATGTRRRVKPNAGGKAPTAQEDAPAIVEGASRSQTCG
jgi:transcriptional regulator with XRE-family HTH domain